MTDQKKFLIQILDVIQYEGEKEAFADLFTDLIYEDAVYTLVQSLPEKKREKVAKKWDANVNNHAALASILKHYFTQEQIKEATEKSAQKAMYDYLQSIDKTLDADKKEKLLKLSEKITASN
jgi:hypothetical protein